MATNVWDKAKITIEAEITGLGWSPEMEEDMNIDFYSMVQDVFDCEGVGVLENIKVLKIEKVLE